MEPYEKRKYDRCIVPLLIVNKQLAPCELLVCDRDFLLEHLPGKSILREKVKQTYRKIWVDAMEKEVIAFKRQNKGRRAANNWLRTHWFKGYPLK